ncbi:MAG: glutamine synthetase [Parasphingorhabdus sp.]|jgi:glutamine synthetase
MNSPASAPETHLDASVIKPIREWLKQNNIDEVEGIIPDMTGIARGKIIPAAKYSEEAGLRLPEAIFLQTVTGEYPEDWSTVRPIDGDIVLVPDPKTIRLVPWASDPTAVIIHDCYHLDGRPVDVSPRYILRKVLELYEAKGWQPIVAPELEFYLVKPNTDADYPLEPPVGRSGRAETGRQSFSIDAVNEFDPLFEDLYAYCDKQNIAVDTLIHESGAAQMEVNLLHGDPLELADQAFLFKRTLRETALKHRMYATFMGKPMAKEPGSAMHIHQSIIDKDTGLNIFSDSDGNETDLFFKHIGGLQKHLSAAMPLFAPNVNSFRRLTRFNDEPINLQWGYDNRTAGLRVPISSIQNRRVENRLAGADANPYLAIAASLACGYLGMKNGTKPRDPVPGSAFEFPFELPRSLDSALDQMNADEELVELLGENFVKAYSSVKEGEISTFLQVISSWEREFLLLNV